MDAYSKADTKRMATKRLQRYHTKAIPLKHLTHYLEISYHLGGNCNY